MPIIRECLICKKHFIPKDRHTRRTVKYCSRECFFKSLRNTIKRICLNCGKSFNTYPCRIRTNGGKYCSQKCFRISFRKLYSKENNPNWKGDNVGIGGLHWWIKENYGRPKKCQDCGTSNPKKKYEWANISGKYRRDIKDFKRLCVDCHRKFDSHLLARGKKHPNAKLSEKDVIKIREMYIPYKYSALKISKDFNVEQSAILRVIKRKTWEHI